MNNTDNFTKVKLSIPIPTDKPDKNGYLFTEESIKKICDYEPNMPILSGVNEDNKVIGYTINKPTFEDGKLNFDVNLYTNGFEFIVNDKYTDKDDIIVINDFTPVGYSFGVSED